MDQVKFVKTVFFYTTLIKNIALIYEDDKMLKIKYTKHLH